MERSDWSVGQCLQTLNKVSSMLAFESISNVKVPTFEKKISNQIFISK